MYRSHLNWEWRYVNVDEDSPWHCGRVGRNWTLVTSFGIVFVFVFYLFLYFVIGLIDADLAHGLQVG